MAEQDAHLSRRERRERERSTTAPTPSAEDLLAEELERQLAPFRTPEALSISAGLNPVDPGEARGVAPSNVTAPVPAPAMASPVASESSDSLPTGDLTPYTGVDVPPVPTSATSQTTKSKPKNPRRRAPKSRPVVPATMMSSASTGVQQRRSTSRVGARIFSWIAIFFVAGIALASSIPAIALMTPQQLAYQAEIERIKYSGQIGDSQSLSALSNMTGTTDRDGVSVGVNAASASGIYQPKKIKVAVPLATNPTRWPFPQVRTSSPYGYRASILGSSPFHTGLDFDLPYGTNIQSVADGIVTYIEDPGPMCGSSIMIDSNVGGTQFTTVYCHMITKSTKLSVGQSVKAGDVVGQIGLTGITTGPHLHLEIRVNDVPIDPWAFLIQRAGNPPS